MMDQELTCPVCETKHNKQILFCTECGCNLSEIKAVTVTKSIDEDSLVNYPSVNVQGHGEQTQKGETVASSNILDGVFNLSTGTENVIQQKVTEAIASLVNMMLKVSNDVKKEIETDMVKGVTLSAHVSFVTFSIGVFVDLAALKKSG
jgi:hypothetical protein